MYDCVECRCMPNCNRSQFVSLGLLRVDSFIHCRTVYVRIQYWFVSCEITNRESPSLSCMTARHYLAFSVEIYFGNYEFPCEKRSQPTPDRHSNVNHVQTTAITIAAKWGQNFIKKWHKSCHDNISFKS